MPKNLSIKIPARYNEKASSEAGELTMSSSNQFKLCSISDYLTSESKAQQRHEYVNGHVLAMSGATEAHNLICSNLSRAISNHLEGSDCRLYHNDMKVHVKSANSFYYPDIMVTCEPFDAKSVYKNAPSLLVEVLSPSTMSTDLREKKIAYLKIPSLSEYVIAYQDRMQIELIRRISDDEWCTETFLGSDVVVFNSLPSGELRLPVSFIYKGYNPTSRVKESELDYEFS